MSTLTSCILLITQTLNFNYEMNIIHFICNENDLILPYKGDKDSLNFT
jgi:hypothetical protein